MKSVLVSVGLAIALGGCVTPSPEENAALTAAWAGRPITDALQALGPPETLVRLSPTQVGYTFARSETVGQAPGATPVATSAPAPYRTITCRVTFVTTTPQDTLPEARRIIENTRVMGCR